MPPFGPKDFFICLFQIPLGYVIKEDFKYFYYFLITFLSCYFFLFPIAKAIHNKSKAAGKTPKLFGQVLIIFVGHMVINRHLILASSMVAAIVFSYGGKHGFF